MMITAIIYHVKVDVFKILWLFRREMCYDTCFTLGPGFGWGQRRSCPYTVFLKFLATSNKLPTRNLSFLKVQKKIAVFRR